MRKLYVIFFALFAFVLASVANCPNCFEYVEDDDWCSDCGMCLSCCEEIGLHCENCGECLTTGNPCSACGDDANHCEECAWDYCCNLCGECHYEDGQERCSTCDACEDCQDMYTHCCVCGDCLADVDACRICGVEDGANGDNHCQTCANDYQCTWCEQCFLLDGLEVCDGCLACEECTEEIGLHCVMCGTCLADGDPCTVCGADIGQENHCQECASDYYCIWCGQCYFTDGAEVCDGCLACEECLEEIGTHCTSCGVCLAEDDACSVCGAEIGQESHCQTCAEDYICENCGACCFVNQDIVDLDNGRFCPDCAEEYYDMCINCGESPRECDECELCQSCIDELYAHCRNCDACLGDGGACSGCGMCDDCAYELYIHCVGCEACFGDEGAVCEECGLCEECSLRDETHCPECFECFSSVEKCENCGYCMDCALDMNLHCSLCDACMIDNTCISDGDHCADCCESNGWVCSHCGKCVEGEGLEFCDICELCEECCFENTLEKNCLHNICIQSEEWETHYCLTCGKCLSDCKHSATYEEHTCNFVDGVCTICKASENGVPTIYRQPQSTRCKVVDANQLTSVDGIAKYDTISFFTQALGEDLEYQWYSCNEKGKATAVGKDTDGKTYIHGSKTNRLTITGPTSCDKKIFYFCKVSNGKGSVTTDTVAVEVLHDLQWRDRSYLSASADTLAKTQTVWLLNGEMFENVYSDYHYKVCAGNGCGKYTGQKALHQYGDWVVDYESIEGREGLRHKACLLCGEKFYQHTDVIADYGQPIITRQPKSVKCITPDFDNLEDYDGEEKYDTISFSVSAKGEDIEYRWHVIYWDDYNNKWYELTEYNEDQDDYLYVNGSTESDYTITVPGYACFRQVRCFCVLSNENGTVTTDSVLINGSHNFKWKPLAYWWYNGGSVAWWSSDVKDNNPTSGFNTIYSDYHYRICMATDDHGHEWTADEMPTKKARHTYGDWTVSTEHEGYVYKECSECGEKYWLKTAAGGAPTITFCSGDKRVKVLNWHILYDQGKKASEVMGDNIVTFSVETLPVTGERCTYQWYCDKYKLSDTDSEGEYIDGAKSSKLTINVPTYCYDSYNAPRYYCVVTNSKGSTTSDTMKLTTTHNMHWCSINETSMNYSYVYNTMDMRDLYLKTVTVKRPTATATESVEKQYSKFHYMACVGDCGDQGFNFKGKKEEHIYGPWVLAVAPTATEYGSRYRVCEVCGEEYWENIDPATNEDNPYSEFAGTLMKVTKVIGGESGDGVYDHVVKVVLLSGTVKRNDWVNVMLPDGVKTVFVPFVGEDEYEEVSSATKGDTVVLALEESFSENLMNIPVGTFITDGSDIFKMTHRIAGHYEGVAKLVNKSSYVFSVNDKMQNGMVVDVSNNKTRKIEGETVYTCSTTVYLNSNVVSYVGQRIPVFVKDKVTNEMSMIGAIVVDDLNVPALDFYIVSAAGDTVRLEEKNQTLFDGQVVYSYTNAKLTLSNADLKCIHLGDTKIGGKSLTIFVKEGANVIRNTRDNAIDVAGLLILSGNKGVTLTAKSTVGDAIKAGQLKNTDEVMWNLNCEGYRYAIELVDGIAQWDGAVEMHAKCNQKDGYAAFRVAPQSGYFGSAIFEDNYEYKYTTTYDEEAEMDVDGYAFVNDEDENSKEIHLYVDPKITFAEDEEGIIKNSQYKNISEFMDGLGDCETSGKISYDFKKHTLTLDSFYFSSAGNRVMHIGKSFLDTLYVKVVGDNNIEYNDREKNSVLLIGQNVKLIGGGKLNIYGADTDLNGVVLGESATLTLSDQVSLYEDVNTKNGIGITDVDGGNASSKFIIEKDAYLYLKNGLRGVTEFVIDNKGAKKTKHILYPYAADYTFDTTAHEIVYVDPVETNEDDHLLIIGAGYDMQIANRWVSEFNAKDIMGDGSVVFDEASKTLKLKDVYLKGTYSAMWINEKNVKVEVEGVCRFLGEKGSAHVIVGANGSAIITGDSMVFEADNKVSTNGLLVIGSATLTDVSALFEEKTGIFADRSLCIRKSLLDFKANSTIAGTEDIRLEFAEFENKEYGFKYGRVMDLSTEKEVKGNFRIIPEGYQGSEETGVIAVEVDKDLDFNRPVYDILGRVIYITEDYQGVVVQDGRKYILKGK